jgi:hypothetical protein
MLAGTLDQIDPGPYCMYDVSTQIPLGVENRGDNHP